RDAAAAVRDDHLDTLIDALRLDRQPPLRSRDPLHGVHAVQKQVQQDLLQANTVAENERQCGLELGLQGDLPAQSVAAQKMQRVLGDLVHVERLERQRPLSRERAYALDDVGGLTSFLDDVRKNLTQLGRIR